MNENNYFNLMTLNLFNVLNDILDRYLSWKNVKWCK